VSTIIITITIIIIIIIVIIVIIVFIEIQERDDVCRPAYACDVFQSSSAFLIMHNSGAEHSSRM
jgi:hypothetical protein